MRALYLSLALVVLGLLAAASAGADPVSDGTARLQLGRELDLTLREAGVRLHAERPAQARGRHIAVPITGGNLVAGFGRMETAGGFELALGSRSVSIDGLVLDSRRGVLVGEVDGRRLHLASARRPRVRRDGFGYAVTLGKLVLADGAARLLNRSLGDDLLGAEDVLGNLDAGARRSQVTVTYGTAYLILDEAMAAKLRALRVEGAPLGSGWLYSPSPLAFALTGRRGVAALDFSAGRLESDDGLRLTKSAADGSIREVAMTGVSLDLADGTIHAELQDGPPETAAGADVGFATLSPFHKNAVTGVLSIGQAPVVLSSTLAASLEAAFAEPRLTPTFVAGELLGSIAFTAGTRGQRP